MEEKSKRSRKLREWYPNAMKQAQSFFLRNATCYLVLCVEGTY
jgi:hypothetical protein